MLDFIASIFKYPMQWFYQLTGDNYLLAMILFALFVKLISLPLAIRQQKTQIKGAKLRPKIAIIERKYQGKRDPAILQQKQQEIMELQQKEGYSPLSGCLPLLIQLPVLLGLYQVVRKPLTYLLNLSDEVVQKMCDFAGSMQGDVAKPITYTVENQLPLMDKLLRTDGFAAADYDIEALPNLTFFNGNLNLGATPSLSFNWLLLIPVLSFVFSFLSMKITRKLNSPVMTQSAPETEMSNKIMDLMMPLMSIFISFTLPAAFGVYWLFGYVFGIIQTLIMAKAMPLPTFTEEELRQYEKEMKTSRSRSTGSSVRPASAGPVRSRHHIDDDDDDTPAKPVQKKNPPKQSGKAGTRKNGVESAPLKDDSDKK